MAIGGTTGPGTPRIDRLFSSQRELDLTEATRTQQGGPVNTFPSGVFDIKRQNDFQNEVLSAQGFGAVVDRRV